MIKFGKRRSIVAPSFYDFSVIKTYLCDLDKSLGGLIYLDFTDTAIIAEK
jgi:hypothetical protein